MKTILKIEYRRPLKLLTSIEFVIIDNKNNI